MLYLKDNNKKTWFGSIHLLNTAANGSLKPALSTFPLLPFLFLEPVPYQHEQYLSPPSLTARIVRQIDPMSTSPNDAHEDGAEKQSVDELADANHTAEEAEAGTSTATPAKRGRGRPKGSKNKKAGASSSAPDSPTTPSVPRKRGRPPKEKKEDTGEEPPPKRPRGRPPKTPKPAADEAAASGEAGESSTKKKRGRPPKKAAV